MSSNDGVLFWIGTSVWVEDSQVDNKHLANICDLTYAASQDRDKSWWNGHCASLEGKSKASVRVFILFCHSCCPFEHASRLFTGWVRLSFQPDCKQLPDLPRQELPCGNSTFLMVMWSLAESKPCGLLIQGFHIWYDRCRCREGCTSRAITSDCRVSCMHISFFVFHEHLSSFWM